MRTITTKPLDLDNPLWHFARSFYARDGVAPACLTLQNGLGLDIDILLLIVFAQVIYGVVFDGDDLDTVDSLVRNWRDEVIRPLRRVRMRMKDGFALIPAPISETLRTRVRAAELESERIALAMLWNWLSARPRRGAGSLAATAVVREFAQHFDVRQSAFPADVEEAILTLSKAIRTITRRAK